MANVDRSLLKLKHARETSKFRSWSRGPRDIIGNTGRMPVDRVAVQGSEEPEGSCLPFVLAFFCCASQGHVQTISTRASGSREDAACFLEKLDQCIDLDQLVWSNSAKDVKCGIFAWQLQHTIIQSEMAIGRAHLLV